jgi:voltage-gated potassium channel
MKKQKFNYSFESRKVEEVKKKVNYKEFFEDLLFSHKTYRSKVFNVFLLFFILFSCVVIILESVDTLKANYMQFFFISEVFIIVFFTIEYILRIYSAKDRKKYIFGVYGIIDFVAIAPVFIMLIFPQAGYFLLLRAFRLFRIFRVLKLIEYLKEEETLFKSIKNSIPRISVFLIFIVISATIFASIMYTIEGPQNGFVDIPTSLYWTIVTITTVGYGDVIPISAIGKTIASILMILGYGVIAIPTGIIVAEYSEQTRNRKNNKKEN